MNATNDPLLFACSRARDNPFFLAWWIGRYEELTNSTEDDLVQTLAVTRQNFVRLCLCRKPNTDPAHFRQELEQISRFCGADVMGLAELIRYVESAESLKRLQPAPPESNESSMLLAAREKLKKTDGSDPEKS